MAESSMSLSLKSFSSGAGSSRESFNSNTFDRYRGLISQSYSRAFRKDMTQLFGFIYSVTPTSLIVHKIMMVFRILQFLLPSLCASYSSFWTPKSIESTTVNVISILFLIIPANSGDLACLIYVSIFVIISYGFIIFLISISFYFKRNAKLNENMTFGIAFYYATFGNYYYSTACYAVSKQLGKLINGQFERNPAEIIVLAVLTYGSTIFTIWIVTTISSQLMIFRPDSLMSVTAFPKNTIFLMTIIINTLFGFGVYMPGFVQAIFVGLMMVCYGISVLSVFYLGGFIYHFMSNIVLSSCITGFAFSLVVFACILAKQTASLIFLFVFIVFYILISVGSRFILVYYINKTIAVLDAISDAKENFHLVRTPNGFINICTIGFTYAHPACLDVSIFIQAVERWPRDPNVWYVYAKFIAIYPEETQTLAWIYHNISTMKLKGSAIRCIKEQSISISRQREANLSAELKNKLNVILKQIQSTKHKLRHVWDVVIQGNIGEIESATKRALSSIEKTDADFKHLFRQFPNNRFVARSYSRFLLDITADHSTANSMLEKMRLLQRGIAVNVDQTHELGMATFPKLPDHIKRQRREVPNPSESASSSFNPDGLDMDDFVHVDMDQLLTLRHRIDELVIPAIRGTQIIRSLVLIILFIIPCIFGIIYVMIFITDLKRPLPFIASMSMLRTYAYQLIAFSLRYIGEELGDFPVDVNAILNVSTPPENIGSSWRSYDQLRYISDTTSAALQEFGSFRAFEQYLNNDNIMQAQSIIFDGSLPYRYYNSPTNYYENNLSIQSILTDLIIQTNSILNYDSINESIINTSVVLNLCYNSVNISNIMDIALEYMISYISDIYNNNTNIITIVLSSLIPIVVIIHIVLLIVEILWINADKQEIYQCLFSLPKNTVSILAENLRMIKRESSDASLSNMNTEMNKQEENILKIFNSNGLSETSISDIFILIFSSIILILFSVGCILLFAFLVKYEITSINRSAYHLNYLMGTYAFMVESFNNLFLSLLYFTPHRVPIFSINQTILNIYSGLESSKNYHHMISYGGNSTYPYEGFDERIENEQNLIDCNDNTRIPMNISEILACFTANMGYIVMEPLFVYELNKYVLGLTDSLNPMDYTYTALWSELVSPLYDQFFFPLHESIIPTITTQMDDGTGKFIPAIVVLLVIGCIIEVFSYIQLFLTERHIRSVLRLLLHCPPDIVLSTPKIIKLLSGDFSALKTDVMNKDSEFFDSVFVSLPDAIMYANSEMIIQAANLSCQRIFGDVELVNHSIKEFFSSRRFVGNIDVLFSSVNSNPVQQIVYKKEDGTEINLEISSMLASGKFVMSCRDITQTVRYNTLIREERAKSDQLLSTILPPSLVKRVQEGEKNISFAVQSASILFSDIVEFTPWCGALPAATVMSTLNILFRRLDAILATKPTMTKIKCIGDCYMAAGGIFAEINQPTEHAKEVVTFGLESIRAILEINKEIGEKLKIRVGVNTGGPIVAGVLGIGKPTFEILGPAINLAQQMEHHGVPMAVHITRSVYELIYGDTFTIRERGAVQVKGGSVITYLVTQKN